MATRAELDFAAAWLRGERGCFYVGDSWTGLIEYATRDVDSPGAPIVLTPAGVDLFATIETLGIDPETARADDDPPEPEDRFCAKCGNTGEIPIIGEFCNPCPDCIEHAFRQAFAAELKRAAPWKNAGIPAGRQSPEHPNVPYDLVQQDIRANAMHLHDGWTLIDSEETAKRFVGKTVEIDAPRCLDWADHERHGDVVAIISVDRFSLCFDGGDIGWEWRGNVRLREVRDPIAQAARRSQQNDWTWQHVQLAGISGVVVPEPQPDPDPPGFGED